MNNKFNLKIALAHICTFAATSTFAYLPNTQNNPYPWYSALELTMMRPSNINYSESIAGPNGASTLVRPSYHGGLNALLGYLLTDQYDVSANYTYNEFHDSYASFNGVPSCTSDAPCPPNQAQWANFAKYSYHVIYDAIALSVGHYIYAPRSETHLYGGLDYTYIQQNSAGRESGINTTETRIDRNKVTFNGVGPQIGLETSYRLNHRYKLVGGANLAFLASNISEFSEGTFNGALKAQANLGVGYDRIVRDYHMSFELGYKTTFVQNTANGHAPVITTYAFGMSGPYLGFAVNKQPNVFIK